MKVLQEMTAVRLLQLKAIKFQPKNPFVWANGWTSPMYCDDRKILSYPKMRDFIRLELARVVAEMYPDVDIIAGVATNAIAHGVLVAEQLGLPFNFTHIDTLRLAKAIFPEFTRYKLGSIADKLGIKVEVAHRALADVETLVERLRFVHNALPLHSHFP